MATLINAIPQDRYVKISSVNGGDAAVVSRDLGGLVFTQGKGWAPNAELREALDLGDAWDPDFLVVVHSATQAAKYFASGSDELKIATRYFAYLAPPPAGTTPATLTFARVKVTKTSAASDTDMLVWKTVSTTTGWYDAEDTLVASPTIETADGSLKRIAAGTSNFGSFTFIDGTYTCADLKAAAVTNAGYDNKFLFSLSPTKDGATDAGDAVTLSAVKPSSFATYMGKIKGFVCVKGMDLLSAQMPMAIFGATDYSGVNTAPNQMYRSFSNAGEVATVNSEAEADALDALNVNYYGLVQTEGATRAFYQRGRNSDGEDTAVYCNEIWLKSRIATDILDLQITVNRISANSDGAAQISSIVTAAAVDAVTNGSIEPGKTLDERQRIQVYQLTNQPDAWLYVQTIGYVVTVSIVKDTTTNDYKAVYRLVYSKGDSIKSVEGVHALV